MAIPLDAQMPGAITVARLQPEPDFALPVERVSSPEEGVGRHHDLLLFNGGRVYWLSGLSSGDNEPVRELRVPGFKVQACARKVQPDDPAVLFVRARDSGAIAEVAVHFNGSTGCIDAAGDMTLSVPVLPSGDAAVVHSRYELPIGLQADGSALGTLRLGSGNLIYTSTVGGMARQESVQPSAEDVGRVLVWRFLARDTQGIFLCGSTDGDSRCALYHFDAQGGPRLTKLGTDDFASVQMGGLAAGRAYALSMGPVTTGQPPLMRAVYEFSIGQPAAFRAAFTLPFEFRPISLDQSVLFLVQDTVRYSQYRLADAASGAVWDTDFVTYGSGSSDLYADHRMGCEVSRTWSTSAGWSGCVTQAWLTPRTAGGAGDRNVYLKNSAGTVTNRWTLSDIAEAAGFVGYETAAHRLIGIKRVDGSSQIWRASAAQAEPLELLDEGDVVLYGSIMPRGSVL